MLALMYASPTTWSAVVVVISCQTEQTVLSTALTAAPFAPAALGASVCATGL